MGSPDSGGGFRIWFARRNRRYDTTEEKFTSLLGIHLTEFLWRKPDEEINLEEVCGLGLTESVNDKTPYGAIGEDEWDIEEIFFNRDCSYFGVDAATRQLDRILFYTLRISGTGDSTTHQVVDGRFWFGGRDRIFAYMAIDSWCRRHPKRGLKMIHGRSRAAKRLTPLYRAPSSERLPFRDNSDMCIASAICNSTHLFWSSALASKYLNLLVSNSTVFERSGILPRRIRDFPETARHLRQDEVVLGGWGLPSPSLGALRGLSKRVRRYLRRLTPHHAQCLCFDHTTYRGRLYGGVSTPAVRCIRQSGRW